jgi:hypothetical protein
MQTRHLLFVTALENSLIPAIFEKSVVLEGRQFPRLRLGEEQLQKLYRLVRFFPQSEDRDPREELSGILKKLEAARLIKRLGSGTDLAPLGVFEICCQFAELELLCVGASRERKEISLETRNTIIRLQREHTRLATLDALMGIISDDLRQELVELEILTQLTNGEVVWFVVARCFEKYEFVESAVVPVSKATAPPVSQSVISSIFPSSSSTSLEKYRDLAKKKATLTEQARVEMAELQRAMDTPDLQIDPTRLNAIRGEISAVILEIADVAGELANQLSQVISIHQAPVPAIPPQRAALGRISDLHPELQRLVVSGEFRQLPRHMKVLLLANFSFEDDYQFASSELSEIGNLIEDAAWTLSVNNVYSQSRCLDAHACSDAVRSMRSLHHRTVNLFTISFEGRRRIEQYFKSLEPRVSPQPEIVSD